MSSPGAAPLLSQAEPRAETRLDLRLDGVEADFSRIIHLAVSDHGAIVVAQPDDGYLLVFDSLGRGLGQFGREGDGPGEFRSIGKFRGWVSDTFWQGDLLNRRASLWRLPGSLVRGIVLGQQPAEVSRRSPGVGRLLIPGVVGVLADGSVLVVGPFLRSEADAGWATQVRDSASYVMVHADPSGAVRRIVAQWPALRAGCQEVVNGRSRPTPECDSWFWSIAPDASRIASVIIEDDRPGAVAAQLTVIDPAGRALVKRRLRVPTVAITRSDADSMRSRRIEQSQSPESRQDSRDITLPRYFRPVTRLVAGRDGTTWLRLRTSREKHQYLVLDQAGGMVGWVDMPENFRLHVAEQGTLWGTETDADGIESVVRYRLEWGAPGRS